MKTTLVLLAAVVLDHLFGDSMLGDAMVFRPIVLMSGEILKNPTLKEKYGAKAESYLRLAEQLYEKWDQRGGWRDCLFSHCPGHVVPQVFFDGRYNTLDGDMATLMLLRDNRTLANELDLVRDHDLIKRVHQYGIMSPMNPIGNNEDYAQYYTWEGDTTVQLDGWAWWTMGMVLRPHEARNEPPSRVRRSLRFRTELRPLDHRGSVRLQGLRIWTYS